MQRTIPSLLGMVLVTAACSGSPAAAGSGPGATSTPNPTAAPSASAPASDEGVGLLPREAERVEALSYDGDLYDLPEPMPPGDPGQIVRLEPFYADASMRVYRVLYHSRAADGITDVGVIGTIWVPAGDPPDGGFPLIAWGPGNNGPGDHCRYTAPEPSGLDADYWDVLPEFVSHGYVVAYTEYEGHGTPLPYPYVVGESHTHSLFDAARAAQDLLGPAASDQVVVAGHSHGGDAALMTLVHGPEYDDGLDIVGVVSMEPSGTHEQAVRRVTNGDVPPAAILPGIAGYLAGYPELNADDVLTPAAQELVRTIEEGCVDIGEQAAGLDQDGVLAADPLWVPAWAARIRAMAPQIAPYPTLYVVAGMDVPAYHVPELREQAEILCAEFWLYAEEDHESVVDASLTRLTEWIRDRFAGVSGGDCR